MATTTFADVIEVEYGGMFIGFPNSDAERQLTVWDSQTGGIQYTALLDAGGHTISTVTADAKGRFWFQEPGGATSVWVQDYKGVRTQITAQGQASDQSMAGNIQSSGSQTRGALDGIYAQAGDLAFTAALRPFYQGARGDYTGRNGTAGTGTDNRAPIQAALNAASNITGTGYYNYLTRKSYTVTLAPGDYYVSAPSSGPSLKIPAGVVFDFSQATLYFQPPSAPTAMWCAIEVDQYANVIVGKMFADNWDGRGWPDSNFIYDGVRLVMTDDTSRVLGYQDSQITGFQGAGIRGVGAWLTWVKGIRLYQNQIGVASSHLGDFTYPIPSGAPYTAASRVATDIWIDDCTIVNSPGGGVIAGAGGKSATSYNGLDTSKTYGGTVALTNTNIENCNSYALSAGGPFVVAVDQCHVECVGATDGIFNLDTCDLVSVRDLNLQYQNRAVITNLQTGATATLTLNNIFKLNSVQEFVLDGMTLLNNQNASLTFANAASLRGYSVKNVAISRYTGNGATYTPPAGAMWSGGTHHHRAGSWDKAHDVIAGTHLWVDATGKLRWKTSAPTSDTDGAALASVNTPVLKSRTAGNLSINSTTFVDLDTALDITLPAKVGDWIEVNIGARTKDTTNPVDLIFNAFTMNGATRVNQVANGAGFSSAPNWFIPASAAGTASGSVPYQLTASDIVSGQVTLRLVAKGSVAGGRQILASDPPLTIWARNLGGS